jgi:low affinity Fe/Cu permease
MAIDFETIANKTARLAGSPHAFVIAVLVVLFWALLGPVFAYSETWQLVINTGTTIVTFLLLFVVQNTQMRDTYAIHLKLDEIIRALTDCENSILDAESLSQAELDQKIGEYKVLANKAHEAKEGLEQVNRAIEAKVEEAKPSPTLRRTLERWLRKNTPESSA